MGDRLDKLRRIKRLQGDLHRLAEWRLAQLAQRERGLAEQQQALITTLNDEDHLHGMFVASMARRLKSLAGETERVRAMLEAQSGRVLDEAKRLKRAELMAGRVESDDRREAEKRDLLHLIEALVARHRDASLP
jgi:hypothetical protein